MIDSKNFLWLGSFFGLLFITYCVTIHLDDLNPQISNLQPVYIDNNQSQDQNSEQEFTQIINIEEINETKPIQKTKTPDKKKNQSLSKDILHFEPVLQTKPKVSTKQTAVKTSENNETNQSKNSLIKKEIPHKKDKPKTKLKKHKYKKTPKSQKRVKKILLIDKINLNSYELNNIFNNRSNNDLNKIAYKYGIAKERFVVIHTKNLDFAHKIKKILIKKSVNKKDIKILKNQLDENVVIDLKERRY